MIEKTASGGSFCNVCANEWGEQSSHVAMGSEPPSPESPGPRYKSLEDFVTRTGVRRDELATLAEIGALNAFGFDRRSALWQIEKVVRPAGELFTPKLPSSRAPEPPSSRAPRAPEPDAGTVHPCDR